MSGTKTDPIIFSSSSEEETPEDMEESRRARGVKLRPMVRHRHKRRSKRARTGGYRVTHSEAQQKQLAEQQNERLQSSLEIAPSIAAPGQDGLFAKHRLPQDFEIMYFGKYYPSSEAVLAANLEDDRYVFAKANHHFDGLSIPEQFAIKANHQRRKNNAKLNWNSHYGEIGQPSIVTTRTIKPGEEITVDYGPHYDYKKNRFQRGRGFVPETWGQVVF